MRLAWRMHPAQQVALKRNRIEKPHVKKDGTIANKPRVFFKCVRCAELFKQKDIQLDHIVPVGPTPGSKLAPKELTWDLFIERLFCSPDNLQVMCKPCHKAHTKAQTAERWKDYESAS